MITAVILAGGMGQRLWPLSQKAYPKQFLRLVSERTMLQETILRLDELPVKKLIIICNEKHRFFVAEQVKEIQREATIILEPEAKNTAPAIMLASFKIKPNSLMLVLPADHSILDRKKFSLAIEKGIEFANKGKLITFGVRPTHPNTDFGYIRVQNFSDELMNVEEFIEKPDVDQAEKLLSNKLCLWNSGCFLFNVTLLQDEMKLYQPKIYEACRGAMIKSYDDLDFLRINKDVFSLCPSESFDKAILERTSRASVIFLNTEWSDIGSWEALWSQGHEDENNNINIGRVISKKTRHSFVRSDEKLLVTLGVHNLLIVATRQHILVADRDHLCQMKELSQLIESEKDNHEKKFRPWGYYEVIDESDVYKVKRICLNPGGKLSLQKHSKRAEHWIVVSGRAFVTKNDEEFILEKDQSTYIPAGMMHRLENKENTKLKLIEVQSGSYFGEDDIHRYEDIYGRK